MISIPFLKKLGRQDCLGLDWGTKNLKWAKIQTIRQGHNRLSFCDCLELPEEETEAASSLKAYVSKNGLSGTPTAVAIQDESLHIRRMELPKMPEEDLSEAIRWQMRDVAEGSMDDYIIRYSLLQETPSADIVRLTLLGYAIKKTAIHHQLRLLEKAGLRPFFLEPTPVSLAYMMERLSPSLEKEWVTGVDIGWKRTYFLAISSGKLHFVRPLSGAATQQAQELKEGFGTKLALEIQHAVDAFSIAYQTEKIEKLFLSGGGAGEKELPVSLSKNLGIPTEVLNPFSGMTGVSEFPLAVEKPYLFGAALGAAFLKP